jgi:hypothetical protein
MAYFPTIAIGVPFFRAFDLIDPAAAAFLTAAGITDPTIANAINRLVKNYKGIGNLNTSVDLWTGSNAIYPFVGGTASAHKFNLKDPRDLDAAFRISFSGGWTHNSNGITANGVNTMANTFLQPTNIGLNSIRGLSYNRTNHTVLGYKNLFGSTNLAFTSGFNIDASINLLAKRYFANAGNDSGTDDGQILGLNAVIRTASNVVAGFKNTTKNKTSTRVSVSANPLNIFIGANNLNGIAQANTYSDSNFAFADFGAGISDANYLVLYSIIQQFQTDLSRNVA